MTASPRVVDQVGLSSIAQPGWREARKTSEGFRWNSLKNAIVREMISDISRCFDASFKWLKFGYLISNDIYSSGSQFFKVFFNGNWSGEKADRPQAIPWFPQMSFGLHRGLLRKGPSQDLPRRTALVGVFWCTVGWLQPNQTVWILVCDFFFRFLLVLKPRQLGKAEFWPLNRGGGWVQPAPARPTSEGERFQWLCGLWTSVWIA